MFSHAVEMHKSVLKRSDNGEQSILKIDIQDQTNFKGTVVNWALTSLNRGSLKITLTVPLRSTFKLT